MIWTVLLVLFLGITYCFYWIAFYNPVSRHQEAVPLLRGKYRIREEILNRELEEMPCEEIWITSRDGLKLFGRYYHMRDDACLHIQFHGYRGSGVRDLSAIHHVTQELGYNTLVVDQRAHGFSQGNTMTFGIKERWDCLSWAEYASERFGSKTPIFLSGVSMGAASVLMASELDLPENVAGIIGDCPYSNPVAVIRKVCRDVHIPGFIAIPLGIAAALVWGRFWLPGASAEKAVNSTKVPVLLIHGTEDNYIPPEMSRKIQASCHSKCYLELFPGATHAGSCLTDTTRYKKVIEAFIRTCLEDRNNNGTA